jgi:hypothetical protein
MLTRVKSAIHSVLDSIRWFIWIILKGMTVWLWSLFRGRFADSGGASLVSCKTCQQQARSRIRAVLFIPRFCTYFFCQYSTCCWRSLIVSQVNLKSLLEWVSAAICHEDHHDQFANRPHYGRMSRTWSNSHALSTKTRRANNLRFI